MKMSNVTGSGGSSVKGKKISTRYQFAQQILNSTSKILKKPSYVVRHIDYVNSKTISNSTPNLVLDATLLKIIFRYLPQETLVTCCSVCKVWSNVAVDPDLWKTMNCAELKISTSLLRAIVRRQPEQLILDWTQIEKKQLVWLIARLPALKNLSLQNCSIEAVLALNTCHCCPPFLCCPPLQILDLSFVCGLNDAAILHILSPPGLNDFKNRLRDLKILRLAGTNISDVALRYITQSLPHLIHLDVSSCQRITDAGVAQIGTSPAAKANLMELNLSDCHLVTELSLDHLAKCEQLIWIDLRHVSQVSSSAIENFAAKSKHDLCVKDIKLIEKRKIPQTPHSSDGTSNTFFDSTTLGSTAAAPASIGND